MHTQTTLCVMSVESVATLIAAKIHVNFSVVGQGTKTANSCHVMQQDKFFIGSRGQTKIFMFSGNRDDSVYKLLITHTQPFNGPLSGWAGYQKRLGTHSHPP